MSEQFRPRSDTAEHNVCVCSGSVLFAAYPAIFLDTLASPEKDLLKVYKCCDQLTLKAPRKSASENVVCLCRLLNILADFPNLVLHTGKHCGPRSDCS